MKRKYQPGDMIRINSRNCPQYVIIISNEGKVLNAYDCYKVFDLETKEVYPRTFMDMRRGAYTRVA